MRGPIGIVFDPLNLAGNIQLVALEIDDAVELLMTTAFMTCGDTALVIRPEDLTFFSISEDSGRPL